MYLRIACAISLLALAACDQQSTPNSGSGSNTPDKSTGTSSSGGSRTSATGGSTGTGSAGSSGVVSSAVPASIAAYLGQELNGGPVSLTLKHDNTFELNSSIDNKQIAGSYNYDSSSGVIKFKDSNGEVAGVNFPMQCRVAEANGGIQLMDASASTGDSSGTTGSGSDASAGGGGCNYFRDLVFKN